MGTPQQTTWAAVMSQIMVTVIKTRTIAALARSTPAASLLMELAQAKMPLQPQQIVVLSAVPARLGEPLSDA